MGLAIGELMNFIKITNYLIFIAVFGFGCVSTEGEKVNDTWALASSSSQLSCDLVSFGPAFDGEVYGIKHNGTSQEGIYNVFYLAKNGQREMLVSPSQKYLIDRDYQPKRVTLANNEQVLGVSHDLQSIYILDGSNENFVFLQKSLLDMSVQHSLNVGDLSGAFGLGLDQYKKSLDLFFEEENFHILNLSFEDGILRERSKLDMQSGYKKLKGMKGAAWRYSHKDNMLAVKIDSSRPVELREEGMEGLKLISLGSKELLYAGFSKKENSPDTFLAAGILDLSENRLHEKFGVKLPRVNLGEINIRKLKSGLMILHTIDLSQESIIYGYKVNENGILGPIDFGLLKAGYSIHDVFETAEGLEFLVGSGTARKRTYELCHK
jgi:hypothetical protein